jgi:predicted transcriptional regulator
MPTALRARTAVRRDTPVKTNLFSPPRAATVRDVMKTDVVAVVPEMTVRELINLLLEEQITGAPVLAPTGKVLGVVSSTDVMRLAKRKHIQELGDERVADIMTPVAFTIDPEESLADLAHFFRCGRVHRALVMEDGILLGVVTPYDAIQAL